MRRADRAPEATRGRAARALVAAPPAQRKPADGASSIGLACRFTARARAGRHAAPLRRVRRAGRRVPDTELCHPVARPSDLPRGPALPQAADVGKGVQALAAARPPWARRRSPAPQPASVGAR